MKSAHVLITEPIIQSVIDHLRGDFTVDVGKRGQFNREDALIKVIGKYDAILPMLSNPITEQVIKAGSRLKIIANHAVGYNNIDIEAARSAGVHVANTPDVLTDACADFTVALLLAAARRLKEAEKYLRDGKYTGWEPLGFLGTELKGTTLGIYGMGRIGSAVASRMKAFGMNVLYHNRHRLSNKKEQILDAKYVHSLSALASQSNILSIHCPLSGQSRQSVNAEIISRMPENGIIINTARGKIIDEKALAEALHEGRLGAAAVDVFENEPEVHPLLKSAPNCIITPHIASATYKTRRAIGQLAADAIRAILLEHNPADIPNLLTI